jgi:hypothetical protein
LIRSELGALTDHWHVSSAHESPFFNAYHAQCVVALCDEGSQFRGLRDYERRALLCAAFFHRFDSADTPEAPAENLERALAAFHRTSQRYLSARLVSAAVRERVYALITSAHIAQAPSAHSICEQILFDASHMQAFEEVTDVAVRQMQAVARPSVIGTEVASSEASSPSLRDYWQGVRFQSQWAQARAEHLDYPRRLETLLKLIETEPAVPSLQRNQNGRVVTEAA